MATTVVPSTLVENLTPKGVLTTTVSITSKYTSATGSSTSQVKEATCTIEIVKSMEEMSLKNTQINNLKKANKDLKSSYKNALITSKGHEQRTKALEEQVKSLQKEVNFCEQVKYIKNYLWNNIIQGIHLQWPSIQIIYEQRDLLKAAQV